MTFGAFIKDARINAGLTLRGFCKIMKADPGNWSKIERGLLPPPKEQEGPSGDRQNPQIG